MRTVPRTRHYVSPGALTLGRPVLSFDYVREAYVLRGIGDRLGPVLREDRRRERAAKNGYKGPERRGVAGDGQSHAKAAPTRSSGSRAQAPPKASGQTRSGAAGQTRSGAAGQTRAKANRGPRPKNTRG